MNKITNNFLFLKFLYLFFLLFTTELYAKENLNFLSLKNDEVNLRQGPSREYPIKLIYTKKYLPIQILDKSETWRKIKDYNNNSGWIHISQLSNKKSAINILNHSIIHKKPTVFSKPVVKLEIGRLVLIKKCNINWCKITTGKFKGWIAKTSLWGKIK